MGLRLAIGVQTGGTSTSGTSTRWHGHGWHGHSWHGFHSMPCRASPRAEAQARARLLEPLGVPVPARGMPGCSQARRRRLGDGRRRQRRGLRREAGRRLRDGRASAGRRSKGRRGKQDAGRRPPGRRGEACGKGTEQGSGWAVTWARGPLQLYSFILYADDSGWARGPLRGPGGPASIRAVPCRSVVLR